MPERWKRRRNRSWNKWDGLQNDRCTPRLETSHNADASWRTMPAQAIHVQPNDEEHTCAIHVVWEAFNLLNTSPHRVVADESNRDLQESVEPRRRDVSTKSYGRIEALSSELKALHMEYRGCGSIPTARRLSVVLQRLRSRALQGTYLHLRAVTAHFKKPLEPLIIIPGNRMGVPANICAAHTRCRIGIC